MSPMRIATLVVATAATVTLIFALTVTAALGEQAVPGGATLLFLLLLLPMLLGTATVAWTGLLAAHCRDRLMARLDDIAADVATGVDHQVTESRLVALRDLARPSPRPRGHEQPHLYAVDQQ